MVGVSSKKREKILVEIENDEGPGYRLFYETEIDAHGVGTNTTS